MRDKIRFAITIGGVSFAVLLILVLRGIMDGTIAKATTYVDNAGAAIFVGQEGVTHMALSTSVVPVTLESAVQSQRDVRIARGIISVPMVLNLSGRDVAVRLVGFDTATGIGGPWSISKGTSAITPAGLVVDESLARAEGLHLGDHVLIGGQSYAVEGFSRGTDALAGKLLFIDRGAAAGVIGSNAVFNYILAILNPGADPSAVAGEIRMDLPNYSVLTKEALSRNERTLLRSLFITPINVMATIGLLVGLAIVGLTNYTAASERLRDFGVLKAIGAPNVFIYGVIVRQALIIGFAGLALGLAFGFVLQPLVDYLVPGIGIRYETGFLSEVIVIAPLMSLVSAVIPVYRIAGVDPKKVFVA